MKIYGMEFSNNEKVRNSLVVFIASSKLMGHFVFFSLSVNFETTYVKSFAVKKRKTRLAR